MKTQYLLQYTVDGKAHYLSNDNRELMAGFVPSYDVATEIDVYDFCMSGEINFIRSGI